MSSPSIDEILTRVRAQASNAEKTPVTENSKRQTILGTIPLLTRPDDSRKIPLDQPYYTIEEFTAINYEDFLLNAYRIVLGREVDGVGRENYLSALRQGRISYVQVLSNLRRSAEGQAHGVKIRWLTPAALLNRAANLPIIGRLVAPFMNFLVRSTVSIQLSDISDLHNASVLEMNSALSTIRKNQANLEIVARETKKRMDKAADAANSAISELHATRNEASQQRAALGRLIETARSKLPPENQIDLVKLEEASLDTFYVAFENRFRGATTEITARSKRYLPIFRTTTSVTSGGIVLDIGCGRGEFLALLRENNIAARGIDLNSAMVKEAQSLDLDVIESDAIAYLREQPENSIAAITGFHIVEHISFKDLIGLFDAAHHALMPGGIILFETPNPESLVVGACTFHYDPTHNKPLPPDYLHFVAESRGFENARIIRKDEDCDLSQPESGFSPESVNDWFLQPPDYAIYAAKPVKIREA